MTILKQLKLRLKILFNLKFSCGKTFRKVKHLLETTTLCGIYLDAKAFFDPYRGKEGSAVIYLEDIEIRIIDLENGNDTCKDLEGYL